MEKELRCNWCDRYMGKAYGSIIATLKCPNTSCRGETQFKIVTTDIEKEVRYKFASKPAEPKKKEGEK